MKLDYLRLCSRASDNPGFIWSREKRLAFFFWFVAGAEGTPPLVRRGFGPAEPRAASLPPPLRIIVRSRDMFASAPLPSDKLFWRYLIL